MFYISYMIKRYVPSPWQASSNTNICAKITESLHVSPPTELTPSLTSNSWGISRRARYSLASLVFISRLVRSFVCASLDVSVLQAILWSTTGLQTVYPPRIVASCVDFTTGFLQAMPPRHPPLRWCRCVARPSSLLLRSASSAHHAGLDVGTEVARCANSRAHRLHKACFTGFRSAWKLLATSTVTHSTVIGKIIFRLWMELWSHGWFEYGDWELTTRAELKTKPVWPESKHKVHLICVSGAFRHISSIWVYVLLLVSKMEN